MTALPPIGTRVRYKTTGKVGVVAHQTVSRQLLYIKFSPHSVGTWFTADEIEELTPDD